MNLAVQLSVILSSATVRERGNEEVDLSSSSTYSYHRRSCLFGLGLEPNNIKIRLIVYAGKTVVSHVIPIPCGELHHVKVIHGFPFLLLYQARYFGIVIAMYVALVVSSTWYVVC